VLAYALPVFRRRPKKIAGRRDVPRGMRIAIDDRMRAAIFFATREGHTRRIAARLAADLESRGAVVDVYNVRTAGPIEWGNYSTACVAASVHAGRHEREMIAFVKNHRAELERLSAAFVSVSLSQAGVQDAARTEDQRRRAAADVQGMIDGFIKATGWHPARTLPVAGALLYTKYNVFIRFVMRRISRQAGGPTDTSRDYQFTDWGAVDRFVTELVTVPLPATTE
jgi:menaquinone-dependent protoporphyrinogen oxidase